MTFKSSNRLGEKRVQFLNSGQNSSIFEALWLLIWILLFTKIKKIMSWAEKCFHLLLELPNKPFKWSTMPIPWLEINCWKSENAKMTQNGLSSPNCIFWLQSYRSFPKSYRNWHNKSSTSNPELRGGISKPKQPFLLRSASNPGIIIPGADQV